MPYSYGNIKISWLGHDAFRLKNSKIIYFDPYEISSGDKADIILITHEHFDHMSINDIKKIADQHTLIVAPSICGNELKRLKVKEVKLVKPGDKMNIENVEISAIPAYNVNKFRSPGRVFHPKEDGRVGYIIIFDGVKIYHAGDTDLIPEMKDLQPDIALIPVSGTYVMTADEAAEAIKIIKPKIAIPMHYGSIVGSISDANRFKELAKNVEVIILQKER
jgi:L-ascorbate metabolism protein UlaG (beta-lactamase superfamily)